MYNKTIWNPGDIITQEKWDNINNNLSLVGAYQLPITIEENGSSSIETKVKPVDPIPVKTTSITIHKTYDEIFEILKQGIICYYYDNSQKYIYYITEADDTNKTLKDSQNTIFYNDDVNEVMTDSLPKEDSGGDIK